jgi:hypothetical protein
MLVTVFMGIPLLYWVGNVGYRALELGGRHMLTIKRYPLMVNAFSFGKTFYEVLSREVTFSK